VCVCARTRTRMCVCDCICAYVDDCQLLQIVTVGLVYFIGTSSFAGFYRLLKLNVLCRALFRMRNVFFVVDCARSEMRGGGGGRMHFHR
jgi:hypothetical protein